MTTEITFTSSGQTREALYRGTGPDLIVCLHARNGSKEAFESVVSFNPAGTVMAFPDGIKMKGKRDWAYGDPAQWLPSWMDLDTDLYTISDLVAALETELDQVFDRVWLMGHSRGGHLVHWAMANPTVVEVDGYFSLNAGLPTAHAPHSLDDTRPVMMWTAPDDPLDGWGPHLDYDDTRTTIAGLLGATATGTSTTTCSSETMTVHAYDKAAGAADFKAVERPNPSAPHQWVSEAGCYAEGRAHAFLNNPGSYP